MSRFINFNALEQDITYTARSMQYLYGSAGYIYKIRITKPDNTDYYMIIREGSAEGNIYEKLETIRKGPQRQRFSFTKTNVEISSDLSVPFIIISGENDVINLN